MIFSVVPTAPQMNSSSKLPTRGVTARSPARKAGGAVVAVIAEAAAVVVVEMIVAGVVGLTGSFRAGPHWAVTPGTAHIFVLKPHGNTSDP